MSTVLFRRKIDFKALFLERSAASERTPLSKRMNQRSHRAILEQSVLTKKGFLRKHPVREDESRITSDYIHTCTTAQVRTSVRSEDKEAQKLARAHMSSHAKSSQARTHTHLSPSLFPLRPRAVTLPLAEQAAETRAAPSSPTPESVRSSVVRDVSAKSKKVRPHPSLVCYFPCMQHTQAQLSQPPRADPRGRASTGVYLKTSSTSKRPVQSKMLHVIMRFYRFELSTV